MAPMYYTLLNSLAHLNPVCYSDWSGYPAPGRDHLADCRPPLPPGQGPRAKVGTAGCVEYPIFRTLNPEGTVGQSLSACRISNPGGIVGKV
jgi:hypothetical protein